MRQREVDVWPGWVDALSSLLMVLIFLLMIFLVAQFYLTSAISGRDDMVTSLNRQVAELSDRLSIESSAGRDLGERLDRVSSDLEAALAERDILAGQLASLLTEKAELERRLAAAESQVESLTAGGEYRARQLLDADRMLQTSQTVLDERLREIARLQSELATLEAARQDLELQVAALDLALEASRAEAEEAGVRAELSETQIRDLYAAIAERDEQIASLSAELTASSETLTAREARVQALGLELANAVEQVETLQTTLRLTTADRDRLMEELAAMREHAQSLEAQLAAPDEEALALLSQLEAKETEAAELRRSLEDTTAALTANRDALAAAESRVGQLDERLAELQEELARVQEALEASEASVTDREVEISNLETRLNEALLRRVDELSRSRSAFFGELIDVLGDQPGVRVVGDRFIFQSEVLFALGSADLQEGGREQLAAFAQTLTEITQQIPPDVDWILRIDGHTDRQPITLGARFNSNWELSTERALSVLYFLAEQGIPEERMAAAGFGEFQPIDPADTPEAYARNRRIELRLDARGDTSDSGPTGDTLGSTVGGPDSMTSDMLPDADGGAVQSITRTPEAEP